MSEENKKKISRRQFLIDTGLVAGGAALGTTLLASCAGKTVTETATVTSTATVNSTVTKTATVTGAGVTVTAAPVTVTSPAVTVTKTATASAAPISLTCYEPTGASGAKITSLYAPRLDTLAGKTIALMACDASKWQTFRILPYVGALIQKKYPTAVIIPMTEFTQGTGVDSAADAQKAKDKGAHAMVDAFAA
jgi:hypothetical protein